MVKNLKILRVRAGLSQKQLADIVNVSQQSINKYENHDVEPNIETLSLLADFFETTIDYIVGNSKEERKPEPVKEYSLNEKEKEFMDCYRLLRKTDRETVVALMKRLIDKK